MAQVYDPKVAPRPWRWSPDRLTPRGRILARGLVWAVPLWEGSPEWARDVVQADVLTLASGTEISDGTKPVSAWLPEGKAIQFDYGQEGYALQGSVYPPQGASPRTSWIYGKPGAAPAVDSAWLAWGAGDGFDAGGNWGFGLRTTGVLKLAVFGGYAQGLTSVANRRGTYAAILAPGDNNATQVDLYVDAELDTGTGVSRTIDTGNAPTSPNMAVSLGGQYREDGTNNEYRSADVDVGAAAIWDRALTEEELGWLHEDPFILFRPEPQLAVKAPPAVVVGTPDALTVGSTLETPTGAVNHVGTPDALAAASVLEAPAGTTNTVGTPAALTAPSTIATPSGTHAYGPGLPDALTAASVLETPTGTVFGILEGWRWRLDDGTELTATWDEAQDTAATIPTGSPRRLRFVVNNIEDGERLRLVARKQGDTPWDVVA